MRILIVDDDINKYSHVLQYSPHFATSKDDAYLTLQVTSFDIVFVNTKFNDDFVNRIRKIDAYVPIYLLNLSNDGKCLIEYASLIDGYLIKIEQVKEKIDRLISRCEKVLVI